MPKLIQRIEYFISRNHLLEKDGKYLVALSGGADSVALLCALHELGYQVEACHCNFQLRGAESDRDEQFCVRLCKQMGIPLHRIHFDTKLYAVVHKESIELAARNLRYRYFHQLKEDMEAAGICVAHHQDDTVETVLMNLIRGTGIQGLKGISAKNGDILRPLLCVDRQDILDYLTEKGQDYVTDSTNLIADVVRNKIRLHIIPMMKDINPAASKNIAQAAHYLEEANKMLDSITSNIGRSGDTTTFGNCASEKDDVQSKSCQDGEKSMEKIAKFSIRGVENAASPEYVLFSLLSPYGFRGKMIEEILSSLHSTGKTWTSETHQLVIDREHILVRRKQTKVFQGMRIPETGCYVLPYHRASDADILPKEQDGFSSNPQKIKLSIREREAGFSPSKDKYLVTLDAEKATFPLTLRLARNGDILHPFGMKGKKLVSDYLTDRKKNLFEKQSQLVLEDAKGQIIWLVGERTSELCRIQEDTKRILSVQLLDGN